MLHQKSKTMESKAHTMLNFKWVKKEELQSTTKINAQDDSPPHTKGSESVIVDLPPHKVCISQPHHQWIPKRLIHADGKGRAWIQKDLLQPKTTQSATKHKINQCRRHQRQATWRSKPTPKANQPCYQWIPKSSIVHLDNGYVCVPKMTLQPGVSMTSSPHTVP